MTTLSPATCNYNLQDVNRSSCHEINAQRAARRRKKLRTIAQSIIRVLSICNRKDCHIVLGRISAAQVPILYSALQYVYRCSKKKLYTVSQGLSNPAGPSDCNASLPPSQKHNCIRDVDNKYRYARVKNVTRFNR
jgi:hypothetical protein